MGVFTIYRATNRNNGKCYVGFDANWPRRQKQHVLEARRGGGSLFHRAIRKHGEDAFDWEIIYQSLDGNHCLAVMEPWFIFETRSYGQGYNLTVGGEGALGLKHSEESKSKMRRKRSPQTIARMRDARLALNYKHSDETKEKIKKNMTVRAGWHHSDEAKAKIGATHRGKPGHPRSPETRAKIGAGHLGRKRSEETKMKMREAWERRRLRATAVELMRA